MLNDHLVARLRGVDYSCDDPLFGPSDYAKVMVRKERMYFHQTLRIHYTRYDVRRGEDTIKPFLKIENCAVTPENGRSCFVMLAAGDRDSEHHPFWYAQVLAVFHVEAMERSSEGAARWRRLNVCWVRWMGVVPDFRSGASSKRMDQVGFVESGNDERATFGFISPADIIRAVHLIPSFKDEECDEYLPAESIVSRKDRLIWESYWVNRLVINRGHRACCLPEM
jgi:hypothetical protein